jgi:hypothetical protein
VLFFQLQAHRIVPRVGKISEPIRHAEHKQDGGIVSYSDAGLTFFDFDQRRPAEGRARGGDFRRNTPAPARITYIVAELAQRARDG